MLQLILYREVNITLFFHRSDRSENPLVEFCEYLKQVCFYFLTHTNPSNFGRILSLFILFHRSTVCDYIPLLFDHFLLFLIPLISILGAKKAEVPRLE